jgi:hypothetical protein
VRLSAGSPQSGVLTPLALVLGARVGLSIEQIDDLAMALELLIGHAPATARSATFQASGDELSVALSGIDGEWLEQRQPMLDVLVTRVEARLGGVVRLSVVA